MGRKHTENTYSVAVLQYDASYASTKDRIDSALRHVKSMHKAHAPMLSGAVALTGAAILTVDPAGGLILVIMWRKAIYTIIMRGDGVSRY